MAAKSEANFVTKQQQLAPFNNTFDTKRIYDIYNSRGFKAIAEF